MKKINYITIIGLFLTISVCAQSDFKKVAQSGMQYLKLGVDASMVGKGEAGIASVKGIPSIFWNPAGMGYLDQPGFVVSHSRWIADISLNSFAAGFKLGNMGNLGLSLVWMDYGELKATAVAQEVSNTTDYGYVDLGTFSPIDLAFGITYARRISESFSVGGNIRYLYENYGNNDIVNEDDEVENIDNVVNGFAVDFGTQYYPGFKSFVFSMTIQNFSPDMKFQQESFSAPLTFKMGASMDIMDLINEKSRSSLLVAIDAIHPRDYAERVNFGAEYDYLGLFQIRGGYRLNYDEGNYTTGAGFRYSLSNGMQIRFDLSYIVITSGRFSSPLQLTCGFNF